MTDIKDTKKNMLKLIEDITSEKKIMKELFEADKISANMVTNLKVSLMTLKYEK